MEGQYFECIGKLQISCYVMIKEKMRIFRVENIFLSSIEENWVAHEDITHQVAKSNVLEG
jgi:hypothetical protein